MTDLNAPFIDAIRHAPDDLSRYEVFADFLQERGDPWGDFVRLQLQLESPLEDSQRSHLRQQEPGLLQAADLIRRQIGDLAELPAATIRWQFARGFVSSLCFLYPLPEHMIWLRESPAAPLLRSLELVDIPNGDELVSQYAEYHHIGWEFDDSPSLDELHAARFPNLRRFQVGGEYTIASEVHLVLRNMSRVEEVAISARYLESESIGSTKLPRLKVLELERFADRPLEAIAGNRSLACLEELRLFPHALAPGDEPALDWEGLRALCFAQHLEKLSRLSLRSTDFGDEGIDLLLRSGLLSRLRSLDLQYGAVTDVGARLLAEADLRRLELLNLSGNYVSPMLLEELRQRCPGLVSMQQHYGSPDDQLHLFYGDLE